MTFYAKLLAILGISGYVIKLLNNKIPALLRGEIDKELPVLLNLESKDTKEQALVSQVFLDLVKLAEYKMGSAAGEDKYDAVFKAAMGLLPPSISGNLKPYEAQIDSLIESSVTALDEESKKVLEGTVSRSQAPASGGPATPSTPPPSPA